MRTAPTAEGHPAEKALEEAQRRLDALRTMMNNEFDD